jgi:hypothetical protein
MRDNQELLKYIGMDYEDSLKCIETEFAPYTLLICDMDYIDLEIYLSNKIRCVVNNNGQIIHLSFN